MCPQGSGGWGKVGRGTHLCVRGGECDSRHAGRVQALKCGLCCHRVFLFRCKPGWQLTQLSPSTCLVESPSFHDTLHTQKCTNLAMLCSRSHSHNFAGGDHAWYLFKVEPLFLPTGMVAAHILTP